MSPWKVILAALVIFASGLFAGVMTARKFPKAEAITAPHPAHRTNPPAQSLWNQQQKELLRRLDKELQLQAEQHTRIEKILKESHERTKAIREKIAPEMKEEVKNLHDQIRAELSPDQQAKFAVAMKAKPRKDEKPEKPDKPDGRRQKEPRDTNIVSTNR